jgi:hypothetical protein
MDQDCHDPLDGQAASRYSVTFSDRLLGEAKGRVYSPDELARACSQGLFPRTTNRHGCVTLHSYHFYLEEGLPQT